MQIEEASTDCDVALEWYSNDRHAIVPSFCVREARRATELKQRCEGLRIKGVTLHSYRYAWAERSANAGYSERYAQRTPGHEHRAYARKAQGQLPSLEDYENVLRNGQNVVLKSETETPSILQARN